MHSGIAYSRVIPIEKHFAELNKILRKSAILFLIFCIIWSSASHHIISAWLELLPIQTGVENESFFVYSPLDWLGVRWSTILLLSLISVLPYASLQIYAFSRIGLIPREQTWLKAVLVTSSAAVPLIIVLVWISGLPMLFEIADAAGTIDGVGVRYDAASVFSIALGASWILVIWALTVITLSLTRVLGLVELGSTRMRFRFLAISAGLLVLTLPVEYDGLRLLTAISVTYTADAISRTTPTLNIN
jgi:Sec-independent protein secretion pathway component TatC